MLVRCSGHRHAILLGTIVVASALAAHGHALAQTTESASEWLAELNATARTIYNDSRSAAIEGTSPFVIVAFDELHLFRDGVQETVTFTPEIYHHYKAVSHVPLGVFSAVIPYVDEPGDRAWRENLLLLREETEAVLPRLAEIGFIDEVLARQRTILEGSIGYIDRVLEKGELEGAFLSEYTRTTAPLLLANARDAAWVQLDGLDEAFSLWRANLSDEEWERLYVIVLGPKMPRAGNLQFEYFAYAMGRDEIGRRLLYGEGIFEVESALQLLGTIVLDRQVGRFFFDDPMRMDRDLLADGAQAYLLKRFGTLGTD
jgi:hypothetical protein